MALTITGLKGAAFRNANKRQRVVTITFDSSYQTGGLPFVTGPANSPQTNSVHVRNLYELIFHANVRKGDGSAILFPNVDYANQKIQVFTATGSEVAPGTDLSTHSVRATILGA